MTYPVVYLTGAPATGKSSVAARLKDMVPSLHVFSYGEELTRYLNRKNLTGISQDDLRTESAGLASSKDIDALDLELLSLVERERACRPILIDSHAVTKEGYGFRVTPFSMEMLKTLNPTQIVALFASPEVTIGRIEKAPGGRQKITPFESGYHTCLQSMVAITYSIGLGLPLHLLDSDRDLDLIAGWLRDRISHEIHP